MENSNKIALVTGGSRGLGKNTSMHLAASGHHVVITYNSNSTEAAAVVKELEAKGVKAAALQLNVAEHKTFAAFAQALSSTLKEIFGTDKFNFLVNNAGVEGQTPVGNTTEDVFDELTNIHFKGVVFLTQALLPLLADGGRIVNISTGLARFTSPGYAVYGALKGAVEVYTRYLAKELGARGINANTVAPGIIETDFTKRHLSSHPQVGAFLASQTALGRIGQPDDIGGVVTFLCSEAGRWVNAQRIEASGGMFI